MQQPISRTHISTDFVGSWRKPATALLQWFALSTRARFEQSTAEFLICKGYEVLVPAKEERKQLCDRIKTIRKPLFPGYIFCRFDAGTRLPILTTPGVMAIVGSGRDPVPVSDEEIGQLTRVLGSSLGIEECSYVSTGQIVRVKAGALRGLEGIVLEGGDRPKLVVSVQLLQRSVAVQLNREDIQPL